MGQGFSGGSNRNGNSGADMVANTVAGYNSCSVTVVATATMNFLVFHTNWKKYRYPKFLFHNYI